MPRIKDDELIIESTEKILINDKYIYDDGSDLYIDGTPWSTVSGGGVSDHGALTGLGDDDHTGYLLASDATNRTTFATNWGDLTGGGDTTLHDHAGISENTTHRTGDGSDHSDVAANTAARHTQNTDTALGSGAVAADHGTASTDQIVNVCYGTGSPPTASTTTEGALFFKYTP